MLDEFRRKSRQIDTWAAFRCERCQHVVKIHFFGYIGDADVNWQVHCGCGGRMKKLAIPVFPKT